MRTPEEHAAYSKPMTDTWSGPVSVILRLALTTGWRISHAQEYDHGGYDLHLERGVFILEISIHRGPEHPDDELRINDLTPDGYRYLSWNQLWGVIELNADELTQRWAAELINPAWADK